MQLQFMNFMKQDATPDAALQAAFDAAETKAREDWEREVVLRTARLEQEEIER